ncbi:hypothetical protein [Streptomyces stelliscabiei]|uniref:hypothetical protein n=1 Tax=Streptomyces stelliscabiei TaxID=146820 RepID=UPI0029B73B7A|nr:hypothetical protein [Streptomyces stelliscabiei]MDX2661004.1 hypothetical protein [Streptomyces stelliscabiei]MDX2715871.1 hypothetical protein [Streptomyces stelliscabiei]MDX2789981.1 hypothetical protein [Streptomyces stelliscabiei]
MDRIAPGHHLYEGPDGEWRHGAPDGRFTRIRGPKDQLREARSRAYGATAEAPDNGEALALDAALRERGVLAATGADDVDTPWAVHIEDGTPVGDAVARLLPSTAEVSTGPLSEEVVRGADVVVSCAGWLPDTHWRHVDAWCSEYGTPWHRCHAEGLRFVLGPLFVPGRGPGYADTRGRILAAADLPNELAAHWAYLDAGHQDSSPHALPPVPWPSDAAAAVIAGLLVEDLLRLRAFGAPAAEGVQLVFDPATATLDRHCVLPLPVTAHALRTAG